MPALGLTRSPHSCPEATTSCRRIPATGEPRPYYTTINIHIIPDTSVQQAELQSGQLSMILHGLPVNAVDSFSGNKNFIVKEFPAQLKAMLYVNPNIGVFTAKLSAPPYARRSTRRPS